MAGKVCQNTGLFRACLSVRRAITAGYCWPQAWRDSGHSGAQRAILPKIREWAQLHRHHEYFDTGCDSFRSSQAQIAADAARGIDRAEEFIGLENLVKPMVMLRLTINEGLFHG